MNKNRTPRHRSVVVGAALGAGLVLTAGLAPAGSDPAPAPLDTGATTSGALNAHVDMVRRILEVGGHQPGEDPLDRAQLLAHGVTGPAPAPNSTAPSTPSEAAMILLERHAVAPTPDQAAAIAGLDSGPAPVVTALARMINAVVSFEVAREAAFAGLDPAVLKAWRAALENPAGPPADLPLLEYAGARFELIDGAHAELVDAGVALARAAESVGPAGSTTSTAFAPPDVDVPGVLAIDDDRNEDNTYGGYWVTIDLGGNDTYPAGNAVGVDVGGNDHHGTDAGNCIFQNRVVAYNIFLLDTSGNDCYVGAHRHSNGGGESEIGWPGSGFLLDGGGDDRYLAGSGGANNGGGVLGRGVLIDSAGKDLYSATGTASAVWARGGNGTGVGGHGLLLDGGGQGDQYDEGTYCSDEGLFGALCPDGTGIDRTKFVKGAFGSQLDLVPNTSSMVGDLLRDVEQLPAKLKELKELVDSLCREIPDTVDREGKFTMGYLLGEVNFWVMILENETGRELGDPVEDPLTNTDAWRTSFRKTYDQCPAPPTPAGPSVSVSDAAPVAEGTPGVVGHAAGKARFTVSLSAAVGSDVSVAYTTANGTATAGGVGPDYQGATGTLVIPAGQTSRVVEVPVLMDSRTERDEEFFLDISTTSTAVALGDWWGRANIVEDDPTSTATLSVNDVVVTEGNAGTTTQAVFTVSLPRPSAGPVSVRVVTIGGTAHVHAGDFAHVDEFIAFAPHETAKQVPVKVFGDDMEEPDESLFLQLDKATGAIPDKRLGRGVIRSDDNTTVSINDVSMLEGPSGTTTAMAFTISLSDPTYRQVSVNYSTADGTTRSSSSSLLGPADYTPVSGTATFAPGDSTKTVVVALNGDATLEPDEEFVVQLSGMVNAIATKRVGLGTIRNDD